MLTNRTAIASLGEETVRADVARGCPQGGVLSPLLWTLVVDELIRILASEGFEVQGYADDLSITVRGRHPLDLARRLQKAIILVESWCQSHSLSVNPSKTELVLFTRRRRFYFKAPHLFGTQLQLTDEVKYLGVILDKKLTWKNHVNRQTQKAISTYWACRRMFGPTWGLKPRVVRWIYQAILEPITTYASIVWWTSMKREAHRKAIERIYRITLLGIIGALPTTPTLAMGALLDIKPPHLTVMATAWRAAIRLHQAEEWSPTGGGHTEILRDVGSESILTHGGDRCKTEYLFRREYDLILPDREKWLKDPNDILTPGGLVWFTDGSKTGIGTGAGIAGESPRVEMTHKLGHHVTVFQAEVFAIWACAKYNLDRAHSGKHIYICSDSMAALKALHKVEIGSKLVKDCALILRQLSLNNRVKLLWVPGHTGIPGNERANELARLGASSSQPCHEYPIGVSTYALKGLAKDWLNQEFTRLWHNANGMRHTRALFKGPSQKLGDTLSHLDRAQLRMLVGLVTGHWYTRKHLARMRLTEETLCPRCEEEDETPLHVLLRCRELRARRGAILGTLEPSSLSISAGLVPALLNFATEAQLPRHSQ
ncbi:uncharacterized protein LOC123988941 [Osmia bicornis bicornis]|uniref:uncharacterized protein LOC123988941 n=1 Tax=Osmia bicornis bicornis TaxID=1437191 RepID=UPI001EAF79D8|nr:uncharacterized protein LOC123988941 [Osmia bicornis bicornis]